MGRTAQWRTWMHIQQSMNKTLAVVLIVLAGIAIAVWLSGTSLFGANDETELLNEIDALDTQLNIETSANRINAEVEAQMRARIRELIEKLRSRGKKVCRRRNGTIYISNINVPCEVTM